MKKVTFGFLSFLLAIAVLLMQPGSAGHRKPRFEHDLEKLSGDLLQAIGQALVGNRLLQVEGDWVEIDIRLRRLEGSTLASLRNAGLEPIGTYPEYARIIGRARQASLERIAAVEEVLMIHLNQPALSRGGIRVARRPPGLAPCGTKTDHARRIADLRDEFNVYGNGIKIGIISDSFRSDLRLAEAGSVSGDDCKRVLAGSRPQLQGELPEEVFLVDDGDHYGGDEGRALAEIIHDIAPGAELYFHGGGDSIPAMAAAIDRLAECDVDIIVDDLFFSRQPMFQDGLIAQAAARAVKPPPDLPRQKQIAYFTVAGNQGPFGIDQTYEDSIPALDEAELEEGVDLHAFAQGLRFLPIVIPTGCGIGLVLQWAEPFSDEDASEATGAKTDLDLYLCEERDPQTCRIASIAAQGCSAEPVSQPFGDPMEVISSSINTSSREVTMYLAVDHYCANEDIRNEGVRFRIVTFAKRGCEVNLGLSNDSDDQRVRFGNDSAEQFVFTAPQMYGHSIAEGVAAVAATPLAEIEDRATIPPAGVLNPERFSARGGMLDILFDPQGNDLQAPQSRQQPKFTAPDRLETSFFGNPNDIFGADNPNDCFEFGGTSASAPYAAAVAALMLEKEGRLTPEQIIQILSDTTVPKVTPQNPEAEEPNQEQFDRLGHGLINAEGALQRVKELPEPPNGLQSSFDSQTGMATLRWNAVEGIQSYRVEIQDSPDHELLLQEEVAATVLRTPALPEADRYRWRIQSIRPKQGGPWSEWVDLERTRRKSPPGIRNRPSSGNGGTP